MSPDSNNAFMLETSVFRRLCSFLDSFPAAVVVQEMSERSELFVSPYAFFNRAFDGLKETNIWDSLRSSKAILSAIDVAARGSVATLSSSLWKEELQEVHIIAAPLQEPDFQTAPVGVLMLIIRASELSETYKRLPELIKQVGARLDIAKGSEVLDYVAKAVRDQASVKIFGDLTAPPLAWVGQKESLDTLNLLLDETWQRHTASLAVCLVGPAGVGKSTLVRVWLNELRKDDWRRAQRVFIWDFYDNPNLDSFFDTALSFFDARVTAGPLCDKIPRLADVTGDFRTIMVFDGVEILAREQMSILETLLKECRTKGGSRLCIFTSRKPWLQENAKNIFLNTLSAEDGAMLLSRLGVSGTQQELRELSVRFNGHPLSLTLLARYLTVARGGKLDGMSFHPDPQDSMTKVLELYSESIAGTAQWQIMILVSAFDNPLDLSTLVQAANFEWIQGVTDQIFQKEQEEWEVAISWLKRVQLLNRGDSDLLTCHPLVKAYFRTLLEKKAPYLKQQIENSLNRRASPLRLYVDLNEYNPDEIAEIISFLSGMYQNLTGDRLVIDNQGIIEKCPSPEPVGA